MASNLDSNSNKRLPPDYDDGCPSSAESVGCSCSINLRGENGCSRKGKGPLPPPRRRSSLPLPSELMAQSLLYADPATLAQALLVTKAMQVLVTAEHWETAATPVRWLQSPCPAPGSFSSGKQAAAYWRRVCKLVPTGRAKKAAGGMIVLGGSEAYRPGPSNTTETCPDVEWGEDLEWGKLPGMMFNRCAAATAVDRWGHLYVVGGWSGLGTYRSCERLSYPRSSSTLTLPVPNQHITTVPYSFPRWGESPLRRTTTFTRGENATVGVHGASTAMNGGGERWVIDVTTVIDVDGRVSHRLSQPYEARPAQASERETTPQMKNVQRTGFQRFSTGTLGASNVTTDSGDVTVSSAGGALTMTMEQSWSAIPNMDIPRCFLGAAFDPHGGLLAIGGGTGLYTNATAFETVEVLPQDGLGWSRGPSMSQARCGLGVATLPNGKIYAAGGYGGNMKYLSSAEVLDPHCDTWTNLTAMSRPRTGVGLAAGPDGSVYAVGGSADGSHGHSSVEHYDPREGKWLACPSMVFGRAYCCAAFGASGNLYVLGGMSTPTGLMRTVEVFDPRNGRWRVDDRLGAGGRAITDACLVFRP